MNVQELEVTLYSIVMQYWARVLSDITNNDRFPPNVHKKKGKFYTLRTEIPKLDSRENIEDCEFKWQTIYFFFNFLCISN